MYYKRTSYSLSLGWFKKEFQEIDIKLVPTKALILGSRWVLTEKLKDIFVKK